MIKISENIKDIQRSINFNSLLIKIKKDANFKDKEKLFPILKNLFENVFYDWNWGLNYGQKKDKTERKDKLYTFLNDKLKGIKPTEDSGEFNDE